MVFEYRDQLGEKIVLKAIPKRIVSLVPSQTELLAFLGLADEVVGITKFCIHPQIWYETKLRVGGTKNVDIEKVKMLKPDLIIGNKEENTLEDIIQLKKIAPVWISDVNSFTDALQMIESIGEITDKQNQANALVRSIQLKFNGLQRIIPSKKVLYCIWHNPDIYVGKNTFIDAVLRACGFENACLTARYPSDESEITKPDFVFLSSEPFPFSEKHIDHFRHKFQGSKIVLVDGEMFSWYGSRMLQATAYFGSLLQELSDQ